MIKKTQIHYQNKGFLGFFFLPFSNSFEKLFERYRKIKYLKILNLILMKTFILVGLILLKRLFALKNAFVIERYFVFNTIFITLISL